MQTSGWKLLSALTLLAVLLSNVDAQSASPRQPIARVGDQLIFEEDLLALIGGQLLQLQNQEYELKVKALESVINQRLLQEEARRTGGSIDTLLEESVDKKVTRPNANELEAYYLAQKDRLNQPLADVRVQLEQALLQARRQQAKQQYLERLRQEARVTILLSRPKVEMVADRSRLLGDPEAAVTIVEFADFQCPYCQEVEQTLRKLMEKYKGKVRLGFRDFPLRPIHPQAQRAAEAAGCAGLQGKYWEYHDLLYANQATLGPENLEKHARTLGLDLERFRACVASGELVSRIEGDVQAGGKAGVSATPTFYINGSVLVGVQPLAVFASAIESELASAQVQKPGSFQAADHVRRDH